MWLDVHHKKHYRIKNFYLLLSYLHILNSNSKILVLNFNLGAKSLSVKKLQAIILFDKIQLYRPTDSNLE